MMLQTKNSETSYLFLILTGHFRVSDHLGAHQFDNILNESRKPQRGVLFLRPIENMLAIASERLPPVACHQHAIPSCDGRRRHRVLNDPGARIPALANRG